MNWLLPGVEQIPTGGDVRCVGEFDRKAYDRAYYHTVRKGVKKTQTFTPAQRARQNKRRKKLYHDNLERERANARARYWLHRDKYAAASRKRMRAKRQSTHSSTKGVTP